ncbi:MAG: hypothetical protein ACLT29_06555 [Ruminococcus callidus]
MISPQPETPVSTAAVSNAASQNFLFVFFIFAFLQRMLAGQPFFMIFLEFLIHFICRLFEYLIVQRRREKINRTGQTHSQNAKKFECTNRKNIRTPVQIP